ncbi:MAG: hypothetical protein ABWZ98_05900 [Nakamurella sp.]
MTETPPERPAGSAVGPLAQEAAMLLDVVADRLEQMKSRPDAAPPADPPADDGSSFTTSQGGPAAGDQESGAAATQPGSCPECGSVPGAYCTACPVCRFMALLRGERPEATAKLVDGALMIVRTLRSLVPEPGETAAAHQHPHAPGQPHSPGQARHATSHPYPPAQPPPARRTGLEHINIL